MNDIDVLESVLVKDSTLLSAVHPEQWSAPTLCSEYDVQALMNHMAGWIQVFAAGVNDRAFEGDPTAFTSADPSAEFQAAAAGLIAGWRSGGLDRTIHLTAGDLPAPMVLSMAIMEYVTHGCELARATGQAVPFSEAELALTLERAQATLPEQYRGEGMPFGHIVEVPADAPTVERLLGFMGRQP